MFDTTCISRIAILTTSCDRAAWPTPACLSEPRRDSLRAVALTESMTAGRRLKRLHGPLWAFYESGVTPSILA